MRTHSKGFTLVEMMVTVAIFGVLVAIVIPNYGRCANRAKEAAVKSNVHSMQTAMEIFYVDAPGRYATQADEADLKALLPSGVYPRNPFTNLETPVYWGADPALPGEMSIFNLPGGGYMIKAHGAEGIMLPNLIVGS